MLMMVLKKKIKSILKTQILLISQSEFIKIHIELRNYLDYALSILKLRLN